MFSEVFRRVEHEFVAIEMREASPKTDYYLPTRKHRTDGTPCNVALNQPVQQCGRVRRRAVSLVLTVLSVRASSRAGGDDFVRPPPGCVFTPNPAVLNIV